MQAAPMQLTGFEVRIAGTDRVFTCGRDEKLLSAMERQGVTEVRVGCRQGGCGACRVRVLSGETETGKMSRAHVSEPEQAAGFALSCRLYPRSDLVLEPAFRGPRRAARPQDDRQDNWPGETAADSSSET